MRSLLVLNPFQDDGGLTHGAAYESPLTGKRWRRAFANDPQILAAMVLAPREVVVVMSVRMLTGR